MIWKACVIILGTYGFFLFEFVLHSWTTHSHSIPDSDDGSSTEVSTTGLVLAPIECAVKGLYNKTYTFNQTNLCKGSL